MGHIAKITYKYKLPEPTREFGVEHWNLPFTVELKENIHIHWQDIRIEMMPDDFEDFVCSLNNAYHNWCKLGKPKELPYIQRIGAWVGEEHLHFQKDRHNLYGRNKEKRCHHYRVFPRTQKGKVYEDNMFMVEYQKNGQYHIHYKNFRLELPGHMFRYIITELYEAVEKQKRYLKIYELAGELESRRKAIQNYIKYRTKSSKGYRDLDVIK